MKPRELDPIYFAARTWAKRVASWIARARSDQAAAPFLDGNVEVVRKLLTHVDSGPRMVINIGADALLSFLAANDYKNIYEHPVVGGRRRGPTEERIKVDNLLGFAQPENHYFGAIALGGTGVRFYGEYCMVVHPSRVPADTRIFDRDSYDLLQPPLAGRSVTKMQRLVRALKGTWGTDMVEMLIMRMLPRLPPQQHLITTGNVSELVMSDQEFVEVHLSGKIRPEHLEEVRQSPDEVAIDSEILSRKRSGDSPTLVEIRWVNQRRQVTNALGRKHVRFRIVTLHGKGYQWI